MLPCIPRMTQSREHDGSKVLGYTIYLKGELLNTNTDFIKTYVVILPCFFFKLFYDDIVPNKEKDEWEVMFKNFIYYGCKIF